VLHHTTPGLWLRAGTSNAEILSIHLCPARACPPDARIPHLDRADPGSIGADQIGTPKPRAEGCAGPLHDGPRRQSIILFADPAPENVRTIGEPVRLTPFIAVDTTEAFTPADRFQVCRTSRVIRE